MKTNYEAFVEAIEKRVCRSLRIPFWRRWRIRRKYSSSYSASRESLLLEQKMMETMRENLKPCFSVLALLAVGAFEIITEYNGFSTEA